MLSFPSFSGFSGKFNKKMMQEQGEKDPEKDRGTKWFLIIFVAVNNIYRNGFTRSNP
jgi:hypothetical protein